MKYIIGTLKAIGLGFIVAAWLFSFELAYQSHIKQIALSAWMGGAQQCKSRQSTQQSERAWETSEYL